MEFKRWLGESKDENWGVSPHVPHPALMAKFCREIKEVGGGRAKIECHVACLVLEVALACDCDRERLALTCPIS